MLQILGWQPLTNSQLWIASPRNLSLKSDVFISLNYTGGKILKEFFLAANLLGSKNKHLLHILPETATAVTMVSQ